jgi:uncharacterized protein (DUF362 family)
MTDIVALVKYNGDVEKTLEKAFDLIDGFEVLKSPVIIKPNICADFDRTGFAVTDVEVVEALIKLVLKIDKDTSIKIVESDSGSKWADEAFELFGYTLLEEKMRNLGFDVSLTNLSRSPTTQARLDGLYFKDPELPDMIVGSKFFISLAVAKTHRLTYITGVLKNLFGLLPRKDQIVYHPHLHEVIVDLNRMVRPDLCIVDARVGLEGWAGLKTRCLNTFIVGKNPVSVDATMARAMGFEPTEIRLLREAEKFDLGDMNPKVLGTSLESIKMRFNPPS